MKRYILYIYVCVLSAVCALSGCNVVDYMYLEGEQAKDDQILISDIEFDDEYKRFTIDIDSDYDLSDSSKLQVIELNQFGDTISSKASPCLIGVSNNRIEKVASSGKNKALVIVDLTLEQEQINKQREAVHYLLNAFPDRHLYVAFMTSEGISRSYAVTQYILENHFNSKPGEKLLLRSILDKIDEMSGDQARYSNSISRPELWEASQGRHKQLIVFSDGVTYKDNKPIDPFHFQIQQQLAQLPKGDRSPVVHYVNFAPTIKDEADKNLSIKLIVDRCKGQYYDTFNINALLSRVLDKRTKIRSDYELTLENPDGRLFMGSKHKLIVNYLENDTLSFSGNCELIVGSVYNPVVVRGAVPTSLLSKGFFIVLLIILFVYVFMQFVIPFVSYLIFTRKYVIKYEGPGTFANGNILNDTCYYCKQEFDVGDEVVVKCKHTIHSECWKENGSKCPDFGARCPDGEHYYNQDNLFDVANGSLYLKWIIAACVAALATWACNILFVNDYNDLSFSLLSITERVLGEYHPIVVGGLVVSEFFGICLAFFSSIYVSIFLSRGNWLKRRFWRVLLRTLINCVIVYLACGFSLLIYIAVGQESTLLAIDWVPWVILGVGMAYVLSFRTPISVSYAIKGVLITIAVVFATIYVWRFTDLAYFDTRVSQLVTCISYCVGLSIVLATKLPVSNRYFLRVSGAIKDMDVALYKWFNASNGYKQVIIGKSVNSDICMSWDLSTHIAPSQLKLIREGGKLYIIALDYGVRLLGAKQDLVKGVKTRIYHSEGFMIGRTKFVYVEMDV